VQALYFSCLINVMGSCFIYMLYVYNIVDREQRNDLLRLIISVSIALFVYFICRLYDKTLSNYMWIFVYMHFLHTVKHYINRNSYIEVSTSHISIQLLSLHFILILYMFMFEGFYYRIIIFLCSHYFI
jgi:hypothetical protein